MEKIISSKLTLSLLVMLGYGPDDMNTCRKIMITLRNNRQLTLVKGQVEILKDKQMIDLLVQLCLDYDDSNVFKMIHDAHILHQSYINEVYFEACQTGKENIVQYLIEHGFIGVNQVSSTFQLSGIAHATVGNQKKIIKFLKNYGGDINLTNYRELSPLLIATIKNKPLLALLLILLGADIEHRAQSGRTALSIATSNISKIEILRTLVHMGADVNAICNKALTPLQWAAVKNNHKAIELLLENNASKQSITPTPWPDDLNAETIESIRLLNNYMPSLKSLTRENILRLMYTLPYQEKARIIKHLPTDLVDDLKNHAERPIALLIDKLRNQ